MILDQNSLEPGEDGQQFLIVGDSQQLIQVVFKLLFILSMSLLAGNSQQRCLPASLLFRYRVRIFSYCWEQQQPTAYSSISSVVDFVSHCWGQQLTICSGIASVVGFLSQGFFKLPTTCSCNCNQRCCVGCVIFIIGCNIQEFFQVFRGDIVALFCIVG